MKERGKEMERVRGVDDRKQQGEERCREREIDLEGEHALEQNENRVVPLLAVATSAQLHKLQPKEADIAACR